MKFASGWLLFAGISLYAVVLGSVSPGPRGSGKPILSRTAARPAKVGAQAAIPPATRGPVFMRAARFAVTPTAARLARATRRFPITGKIPEYAMPEHERPRTLSTRRGIRSADPVIQSATGPRALNPPLVSFEGNSSADNAAAFGFQVSPPDTNGAVGPNHYVQTTNLLVGIFDKSGNRLVPAFKMSSLFASLGPPVTTSDDGDPIVLYDQLADRWLLSQFFYATLTPDGRSRQLIAISQTGDPTGAYYVYDFVMPNTKFNDYPHFGVWPDGYYMTDNQFNQAGTAFLGAGAFAFDRRKMLLGDPTAGFIYFDQYAVDPNRGGQLPATADGLVPPPPGTPNYFAEWIADEFGAPADAMRIYEFHADFATPANSTFTERADSPLAVAAFDGRSPNSARVVEQPPPATATNNLDALADRLMFRLQYRNFGTHESLVVCHTVNVSGATPTSSATYQAGTRYYEFRRALPGGSFTVPEQATYAPGAGNGATGENRWMGSAATNWRGDLAVGFSVSGTTVFPSVRYAGRLAGDPANQLAQGEASLVAGTGVQRSSTNRWGDYSALTLDPVDDCTFWFTTEYYTAASQATSAVGWLTRIGSFRVGTAATSPRGTIQGTVTNCGTGQPIPNAVVETAGGFLRMTNASGQYSLTVAPGGYTLNATHAGYTPASGTANVTDGSTNTVNICLAGFPVMQAGTTAVVTESCSPGNGGIDPGEQVTLSFGLQNVGGGDTSNLVATLQATGGVLAPGGPQPYGAVTAGGSAVSRSFTFTASGTCGGQLTATLHLQDGAANLGTVSFTFVLGALTTVVGEDFDGVTAPALPGGWTTTASGVQSNWTTVATTPDTAPNAAFSPDPNNVGVNELVSPSIAIASPRAQLSFRNSYKLESGNGGFWDGGVLEVKIGSAAFQDILTAGGSFVSSGYVGALDSRFSNPLGGRQAWSGDSGGYLTTLVNLPASAAGQNIQLRWRCGTDDTNVFAVVGWRIDTVQVKDYACCSQPTTVSFSTASFSVAEDGGSANITVTRSGGLAGTSTVSFSTGGGTATPGADYTPVTGRTLTFNPGDTLAMVSVPVLPDYFLEADETVPLTLSSPSGAVVGTSSATLTITDDPTFAVPGALAARLSFPGGIALQWRDRSGDEAGFQLQRSTNAGFAPAATQTFNVPAGQQTYTDTTVAGSTHYYYRVRAVRTVGAVEVTTSYSNTADLTTPAIPAAPTGFTATAVSGSAVDLAWTDTNADFTGFVIDRKPGSVGDPGSYIRIARLSAVAGRTSYVYRNTGLSAGQTYTWQVRASGLGDYSAPATTGVTVPSAPGTPVLTATPQPAGVVQLSWTAPLGSVSSYQLFRKDAPLAGAGSFRLLANLPASTRQFTDRNLTQHATYTYRVQATGTGGTSPADTKEVLTLSAAATPGGVTAQALSQSSIRVRWTYAGADSPQFEVQRKPGAAGDPGTFARVALVGASGREFQNGGLASGTTYTYRVRAFGGNGTAEPLSATSTATTQ